MKTHELNFRDRVIKYYLEKRDRKTMQINVYPNFSIKVIAPFDISKSKIDKRLKKRASWIIKQLNYFEDFPPKMPKRKYISGETHRYLGKQYRLKVLSSKLEEVKLIAGYINIYSKSKNNAEHNKMLLDKWDRLHAVKMFRKIMNKLLTKLNKYGINAPVLKVKKMKKRWGSCIPNKKVVILNDLLIKTPVGCIEYVLCHELCHLKYPNHDKGYYNFLSRVLPNWKERKRKLEHIEY